MIAHEALGERRRAGWRFDIESVWPDFSPTFRVIEYYVEDFDGERWIVDESVYWESGNDEESTIEAPEVSKVVLELMRQEVIANWIRGEVEIEYGY